MASAVLQWQVPSCHFLNHKAMAKMHHHPKGNTSTFINHVVRSKVHLTMDTSSRYGQDIFISLTVHWITLLMSRKDARWSRLWCLSLKLVMVKEQSTPDKCPLRVSCPLYHQSLQAFKRLCKGSSKIMSHSVAAGMPGGQEGFSQLYRNKPRGC